MNINKPREVFNMVKASIAVLVSGGGTNLQALIDYQNQNKLLHGEIKLVISSKANVMALSRAKENSIKTYVVERSNLTQDEFEDKLLAILRENKIDIIVLAGFMCLLSANFTNNYVNKIINVHPSLIPSFCGKGYYGLKVHEAVLKYGVKITGATAHFVNEIPDGGKVIMQKSVNVLENDTAETLQKRVMEQAEWVILPTAVEEVSKSYVKSIKNK